MFYFKRDYSVYAFLVGMQADAPWVDSTWRRISDATSSVFSDARGRPEVRSTQLGGALPPMRRISFGRIAHSEIGASKWTHSSDGMLHSGQQAYFLNAQVWGPSWNVCSRENRPPDAYLDIGNELSPPWMVDDLQPKFSSTCIFAVADDLGEQVRTNGRRAAECLAEILCSSLSATSNRPWGRPGLAGGFTDAIQDLLPVALFEQSLSKQRHQQEVRLSMLKGDWKQL